ncbi:MAG: hypothetical protein OEY23_02190 [Acidimicrobiia bacterium]|nr:hypothetical protein [Acidimicrobiia bacterium]
MRLRTALVLLPLCLAPLAACGGSSSDSSSASGGSDKEAASGSESGDKELEAKVAASLKSELADDQSIGLTDEQTGCMAKGMVAELGADRIEELGFDEAAPTEAPVLTEAEADKVIPVFKDCVDFGALIAQTILEDAGDSLSAESAKCVADQFSKLSIMDEFLKAALTGATEEPDIAASSQADLIEAMTSCLSDEELGTLGSG